MCFQMNFSPSGSRRISSTVSARWLIELRIPCISRSRDRKSRMTDYVTVRTNVEYHSEKIQPSRPSDEGGSKTHFIRSSEIT